MGSAWRMGRCGLGGGGEEGEGGGGGETVICKEK